jgi:hypothetical protein
MHSSPGRVVTEQEDVVIASLLGEKEMRTMHRKK